MSFYIIELFGANQESEKAFGGSKPQRRLFNLFLLETRTLCCFLHLIMGYLWEKIDELSEIYEHKREKNFRSINRLVNEGFGWLEKHTDWKELAWNE